MLDARFFTFLLISGPASVARSVTRLWRVLRAAGGLRRAAGSEKNAIDQVCANICPKNKQKQSAFKRLQNLEKAFIRTRVGCLGEGTSCLYI